ncbi:doublecortin domain-containing protein 2B [Engraulis encrasicolus]|uniref:doublecortin domain-containing protein 2B n=1 Tax=Engraulis encrasicolus TaxID=184585 RepID=UPI002FCFBF56
MTSGTTTVVLPPVKSVVVYRNGDPFFTGRRFVVNQRQVACMEAFLNDVTQNIHAPLAVRTLYTPRNGHRIRELEDLQTGSHYVAAGFERFKRLDYLNTGVKKPQISKLEVRERVFVLFCSLQARPPLRPNVSARWRKIIPIPCIIHVFRNGDVLGSALRFILPRSMLRDLEQVLCLITEKAALRTGAVRRLCTLDGVTVTSAQELVSGQCYVAVGTEKFKKLPYLEVSLPKAAGGSADRFYPLNRRQQQRKYENMMAGPQDTHSDSALLDSPEMDGRRVKSTGDEAEERSPGMVQGLRSVREEKSVFYAKPVRVRKNPSTQRFKARPPPAAPPSSVFQAQRGERREEVRGAQEVEEDENIMVDVPVDQRVAETVEEEERQRKEDTLETGLEDQGRAETPEKEDSSEKSNPQCDPEVNVPVDVSRVMQTPSPSSPPPTHTDTCEEPSASPHHQPQDQSSPAPDDRPASPGPQENTRDDTSTHSEQKTPRGSEAGWNTSSVPLDKSLAEADSQERPVSSERSRE